MRCLIFQELLLLAFRIFYTVFNLFKAIFYTVFNFKANKANATIQSFLFGCIQNYNY